MKSAPSVTTILAAILVAVAMTCDPVVAFQNTPLTRIPTISSRTISRPWSLKSSKDDEIAKLEEQLQKLKEAKEAEQSEASTPQSGSLTEVEEEVDIGMFLSEGWKEKEAEESSGGGFTGIIGAVVLVLGLLAFSQVPIGQEDLSKYSAIKAPTEQIDLGDLNRARNAGDL